MVKFKTQIDNDSFTKWRCEMVGGGQHSE